MKSGCFSSGQAVAIGNGNQVTDEDETYSPGFNKRHQNRNYHALNDWASPGVPSAALSPNPGNFVQLGRALHYYQDTFSHAGYSSSVYGHFSGGHHFDKTNSDPEAAMKMAEGSWRMMLDFGEKMGCACKGSLSDDDKDTIRGFIDAPGSDTPTLNEIDSTGGFLSGYQWNPRWYLDGKIGGLGVSRR